MGKIKRFFKHIEKFFVRRKQQLIMHHLLYHAGGKELIARYTRNYQPVYEPITETSPIWTCWWQGENAMPDRKSLLQRHAPVFRRAPGHSHYGKEL